MALLFDYQTPHESNGPSFNCQTLHLTYKLLRHTEPTLSEDLETLLHQLKPLTRKNHTSLNLQVIDNSHLLNTLGTVSIHKIINALIAIGNESLCQKQNHDNNSLQSLKLLINHWSDFGEWIVKNNH